MDVFQPSDLIEVRRDSSKGLGGRGVFARRRISEGTVIERVPVIILPRREVLDESNKPIPSCRISWYVYLWDSEEENEHVAVALGYGSIYNHSFQPNAYYQLQAPDAIEFIAYKQIEPDEEITVNYNGTTDDETPVEFHPAE